MSARPSRLSPSPHALLRWCLGVGLWLLVLLVQQAGWQHTLRHIEGAEPHAASHAAEPHQLPSEFPVRDDMGHGQGCPDCLAFHAGVHALPVDVAALLPVDGHVAAVPVALPLRHVAATSLPYRSRAPPAHV